jgi:hypothetical protein
VEGLRLAFAVDADGKGYVQEIAVPWSLLTVKKAAQSWRPDGEDN